MKDVLQCNSCSLCRNVVYGFDFSSQKKTCFKSKSKGSSTYNRNKVRTFSHFSDLNNRELEKLICIKEKSPMLTVRIDRLRVLDIYDICHMSFSTVRQKVHETESQVKNVKETN